MPGRTLYPLFKAFTSSGDFASGYKIYTYEAGTDTPLTTYSDNGLTSPNMNPIVLNSLGEAEIFLSQAAKFTLTDTDDAIQDGWPVDNIAPNAANASTVVYDPTGYLSATNVQDALDEVAAHTTTALDVSFTPTDDVAYNNVQEAIAFIGLATGTSAVDAAFPVGTVRMCMLETPPAGTLEIDGTELSRVTYSALFALWGTRFGAGDGSTTFNLPDFRGDIPRGWDHGAGHDPDAATRTTRGDGTTGDHVGTHQLGQNESHLHGLVWPGGYLGSSLLYGWVAHFEPWSAVGSTNTQLSGGLEARMRNISVMFVVKY